ncbi:hypothetical protein ACYULU_06980 [Breznakiellaceae bacterium SP9]
MPHKGQYYIPQGDHKFIDWTPNFVQAATENAAARVLGKTLSSII